MALVPGCTRLYFKNYCFCTRIYHQHFCLSWSIYSFFKLLDFYVFFMSRIFCLFSLYRKSWIFLNCFYTFQATVFTPKIVVCFFFILIFFSQRPFWPTSGKHLPHLSHLRVNNLASFSAVKLAVSRDFLAFIHFRNRTPLNFVIFTAFFERNISLFL